MKFFSTIFISFLYNASCNEKYSCMGNKQGCAANSLTASLHAPERTDNLFY
jgi:hypothetical protein